jgi:hypothetical protein
VLSADDAWWAAHYPPSGWGCKCFVETLSQRDVEKQGLKVQSGGSMPYTGTLQGVDKGWDYAPGADKTTPLVNFIRQKQNDWPPTLFAAVQAFLKAAGVQI